jgi:hypothetical protein
VFRTEQTPLTAAAYDGCRLKRSIPMLSTLLIVLVALWLLGIVTSYTFGGLIHLLLVLAIIVVVVRLIQGRSPLHG